MARPTEAQQRSMARPHPAHSLLSSPNGILGVKVVVRRCDGPCRSRRGSTGQRSVDSGRGSTGRRSVASSRGTAERHLWPRRSVSPVARASLYRCRPPYGKTEAYKFSNARQARASESNIRTPAFPFHNGLRRGARPLA
eukprot:scaffold5668_cov111-Isochrysis_galbana.AAC.27